VGLFVNGLPVATLELKNSLTGQNFRHAERQYRHDRAPANERGCVKTPSKWAN